MRVFPHPTVLVAGDLRTRNSSVIFPYLLVKGAGFGYTFSPRDRFMDYTVCRLSLIY